MQGRKEMFVLVILTVVLLCVSRSNCQVTFSRDWNAGKRSIPECFVSAKSAASLCQMFINELRGIAACEIHSIAASSRSEDMDNPQDVFSPPHTG